jgi:hypothetical protein
VFSDIILNGNHDTKAQRFTGRERKSKVRKEEKRMGAWMVKNQTHWRGHEVAPQKGLPQSNLA